MSKHLNENTSFTIDIKTLMAIAVFLSTLIGMWFSLKADIAEAKKLPHPSDPEITRIEFDMKDQLIRQTIMDTQDDVAEMKDDIKLIKRKLYNE